MTGLWGVSYNGQVNGHYMGDDMYTYTVTVAQAKAHLSEILGYVENGQEVIITKRGKPIAHIEAIGKKSLSPKKLKEFRKNMPKVKTSSAKLLRKMRDEGY